MNVECWFDGSCEPINPHGHTSYGAVVKENGRTIFSKSGYVGVGNEMSNNVGEYAGIIAVMEFLIDKNISYATIYGDSKLVVKQLTGKWRARNGLYLPYYRKAIVLRRKLPNVEIKWISRDYNMEADWLSRQAIKTVPRSESRNRELVALVKEQKADMRRDRGFFDATEHMERPNIKVIKYFKREKA